MGQEGALSAGTIFQFLYSKFKKVPDHRNPLWIEILLPDFLMSALAIFSLKFPSLLKFEEAMREKCGFSNLGSLFGVSRVPSDTQMRAVLDEVQPENLRSMFTGLFARAQRAKILEEFEFLDHHYLVSVDGTNYFSSNEVHCESCLTTKKKNEDGVEQTLYSHKMLAGAVVHPNKNTVIPLCPEPIQRQKGQAQSDSEQAAMSRFVQAFRKDHPKLKVIILSDALHSNAPQINEFKAYNLSFILSVKPGSHIKLFESLEKFDILKTFDAFFVEEEIGNKIKKKRTHEFRFKNRVLLNHADLNLSVNFLEYWETTQWVDQWGELQQTKLHFSWVTDIEITRSTIMQIMRGGRARWKIENETFNTLKNQGYEFEHNFGHGLKHLSTVFAFMMMLAFLVDQLQELGCKQFQEALKAELNKRSRLWEAARGMYLVHVKIENWVQFFSIIANPNAWKMVPNTS
jgi:hypothetical protein